MHVDADDASMMPDTSVPDSPKVFSSYAALPNGTCLQEFEVTGVVGEGGFGIVYLAQDKQLHRTVAIKEYMPASLASRGDGESVVVRSERHQDTFEAGRRSFITEARMLAQFKHPALVEVFRFWEQNGTVSRQAKRFAIGMMCVSSVSMAIFAPRWWMAAIGIGVMALVSVWLWRRPEPRQ